MLRPPAFVRIAFAAALALATGAAAQSAPQPYEPYVGQDGKDVVWVPTPQPLVDRMLDLAQVRPGDVVIDLGSGDGRTVIAAAKRGARALGIEHNADMVALARRNARAAGVADKAEFRRADLFQADLAQASVLTMFLLPEINLKLRPRLLALAPGTRIVSNTFRMGDWKPDASATVRKACTEYCTAYLWIVPARVGGTWTTADGTLTLRQRFQYVTGTVKSTGPAIVTRGKVEGDTLRFTAGDTHYEGRVAGDAIEGTAKGPDGVFKWAARRI